MLPRQISSILGDKWIFAILREAFFEVRHFEQFQANLGIASNILSDRLKSLVKNGILKKTRDRADAGRMRYTLSQKGLELYTVVLALMRWGDKWLAGEAGPPLILRHTSCGHCLEPVTCCSHCGQPVHACDVTYEDGPGMKDKSLAKRRTP